MDTILIIEDDSGIRNLLKRHLTATYQIIEAEDAARALTQALEQKPDCILLDLNLPDLSGFELCEVFARINATRLIPIIVITAEPALKYRELCLNLGAADYIEKPLDFADLKARVATAIQSRRPERRKEPRVRLSIGLKLVYPNAQGTELTLAVPTNDVSAGGFSCMTPTPFEVGSMVQVLLTQAGNDHVVGRAAVVRVEYKGTARQCFGFLFTEKTGQWVLQ